jgi:hypothetical protein
VGALETYLADHLAGATFGIELVRRCRRNNEGSEFAAPLERLVREIEADREALIAVMEAVGAKRSRAKTGAAWLFEKATRLKPNGRPLTYTPLARVLELEALATGIAGKRALWRALAEVGPRGERLAGFDFHRLAERAEDQHDMAERLRLQAGRLAFGCSGSAPGPAPKPDRPA